VVLTFAVPPGHPGARVGSRTRQVAVAGGQVQVRQRRDGRPLLVARGGSASACTAASRTLLVASRGAVDVVGRIADATLVRGRLALTDRCIETVVRVLHGSARAWSHRHPGDVVHLRTGRSHRFPHR